MDIPFTGGCACRAIRYKCTGAPRYMGNCHCRDCQRATGSAYFAAVLIRAEEFFLIKGNPNWFETAADEGHPMRRAFCTSCGSPLFLENGARQAEESFMQEASIILNGINLAEIFMCQVLNRGILWTLLYQRMN